MFLIWMPYKKYNNFPLTLAIIICRNFISNIRLRHNKMLLNIWRWRLCHAGASQHATTYLGSVRIWIPEYPSAIEHFGKLYDLCLPGGLQNSCTLSAWNTTNCVYKEALFGNYHLLEGPVYIPWSDAKSIIDTYFR